MHNREKTHCPAGHAYDEPNTYVREYTSRESRQCRACDRVRHAAAYRKKVLAKTVARRKANAELISLISLPK